MKFKIFSMVVAVGMIALLPACSGDDIKNEEPVIGPRHVISLNEQQKNDVAEVNRFGFRLWNNLQEAGDSQNEFYSPLGVHFIMSMLANGADGETLSQIIRLSGCDDIASLNELDKKLLAELPLVDNTVTMSIANSCWLDKNYSVLDSYSDALNDVFGCPVMRFNIGTASARNAINKWCADNTGGMIRNFLEENPTNAVILINALYFCGRWEHPFDPDQTAPATFHNADGSVATVDMMKKKLPAVVCVATDRAYIAFLNYGNSGYSMKLIIPREDFTLSDLTEEDVLMDRENVEFRTLTISLPRFSIISDFDEIAGKITAMGYDRIFSNADYSRLFGAGSSSVNGVQIFQKSRIDVDESGARAAAVTSGELTGSMSYPFSTIVFDRPFMFTIEELSTGAVLFMGKVTKL